MPNSLPARPNLEHLKNQAKDLRKQLRAGQPAGLQRARDNHPGWQNPSDQKIREASLSDVQLIIAREYGCESWPRLKHEVERRNREQTAIDPLSLFRKAFSEDDVPAVAELLETYPQMKARINDPIAAFDSPVVTCV